MIYLKLLFAMMIWGGTFTSAKMLGAEMDPMISALFRFMLASSALLLLVFIKEGTLPKISQKQFFALLGMGATGIAAYNLLFFYGLLHAEASRGSLITASNPVLTAVASIVLFKERLTPVRLLGLVLCVFGAFLIISKGDLGILFDKGIGLGEIAFIGCAFSWAIYTLIGRFISNELSSLVAITYASCFGTVFLLLLALVTKPAAIFSALTTLNVTISMHLLYLAILATVVGFVWFQEGVKVLGAARAAVFIYFMPVSAVFIAFFVLDEQLSLVLLTGAALIISGIYLVNRKPQDSK
ncbi:DMT family transporter [Cocleimonas sp. KMM 6892]|uniref:DMT family transporter n=1 Tax=unclassified Cocleimonas TaxID=2639732 RepID=UPI002DBEDCD9|nr:MULTISPECIES: DMT family transporter [unclassified Cocleimonas]MEB8430958.1 DMT family transporter [Cocleimonas sp. KMM 6892]MEC4714270.1 DMT family transporter [Cocleimonas sp. KMM 6895]MEC4743601.1 DMT family transporter [Cocleimonas sp. KMM 6896]